MVLGQKVWLQPTDEACQRCKSKRPVLSARRRKDGETGFIAHTMLTKTVHELNERSANCC